MTFEIGLVLFILLSALVLFFSGWIRMDITALLVLATLSITGLITPAEAIAGFSNPAVITVWAMFILSAGLYQTGVARIIGKQVLKLAGKTEFGMVVVIMISSGVMSAFMNNIGVAALMLPVVMDIARSTGRSPSRLLMPLAYGCLLGGLTTLIGTPPNLLISFALQDGGFEAFRLFDYTPVGLGVMIGGIGFIALVGRHLLPTHKTLKSSDPRKNQQLPDSYSLRERTFTLIVHPSSHLVGKTLSESRLRAALSINVLSVKREGGGILLDPGPDLVIRGNDKLFVQGRWEALQNLKDCKILLPGESDFNTREFLTYELEFFEAIIGENASLSGKPLREIDFFRKHDAHLLAVRKGDEVKRSMLQDVVLESGDVVLFQRPGGEFRGGGLENVQPVSPNELIRVYRLHEVLFLMDIGKDSGLSEKTIEESQLGSAFGLSILGVIQPGKKLVAASPKEKLKPGSRLLVKGNINDLPLIKGLKDLELTSEETPEPHVLETDQVQLAEVVLAPRSLLAGKTLREINFRKKYGLTVLAIWREGRAYRTNLHNVPLRPGEALLLYGKREKLEILQEDADFILLSETLEKPLRTNKALSAFLVMAVVILPVLLGLIPLVISAVVGIALMVLTGCLRMEEAYRAIEWRAVFLIAGMLPLGTAMQQSGAASYIAEGMVDLLGGFGPWGIIIGLYLITSLGTLAIPPPALVVVMSPVALQAAAGFDISPYTIMMAIAIAAASSFMSPVSHPANLLVMGPGGYRFTDYIKIGVPLSLVAMIMALLLLPVFWPPGG